MRSFVYVKCGLLRESLETYVALVGSFARVCTVVDLEVLLARERRGTRQALKGPPLHCGRHHYLVSQGTGSRNGYTFCSMLRFHFFDIK